jgi:hypothetical protein
MNYGPPELGFDESEQLSFIVPFLAIIASAMTICRNI